MLCWIVRGRAFVEGTDSYRRTVQKTEAASKCSKLAIINIRRNLRRFGSIYAPQTREGRNEPWSPPLASDEPLLPKVAPRRPPGNVHEVATAMATEAHKRVPKTAAQRLTGSSRTVYVHSSPLHFVQSFQDTIAHINHSFLAARPFVIASRPIRPSHADSHPHPQNQVLWCV